MSDAILLKIITGHPNLSETDYRALESWWLVDRKQDESAVDFLVRQGIFTKDAPRTVEMLRKGIITYWDPKRLFGEFGHQKLREYTLKTGFLESRPGESKQGSSPRESKSDPLISAPNRLSEVKQWLAKRADAKGTSSLNPAPLDVVETVQPSLTPVHAPPSTTSKSLNTPGGSGKTPSGSLSAIPDRSSQIFDRRQFPHVGEQIGKYLLTEEVARGGTAVVFRALNRSLNCTVAIKVLKMDREEGLNDEQQQTLDSLRREAQLLARFNHPNLVRVYDLEEEATFPFLVLEFVDGLTLCDILAHVGRLRVDRAVRIISAVVEGLSAAQRKIGLVHRDVKPGNILLSRDGCIKLADLGLAMTTDTWSSNSSVNSSILAGTAAYMAPELCTSGEVDLRTDIYSLGATFYHAVVGEMPFKGRNRMEIMLKHTREMPTPPHQLISTLDPSVSEVILRMMAKNPLERYQSYDELIAELNQINTSSACDLVLPALASTAS